MCLGKKWQFTYLNAHAERLLEAVRRDLLGHVIWDAFPAAIDSPGLDLARDCTAAGGPLLARPAQVAACADGPSAR